MGNLILKFSIIGLVAAAGPGQTQTVLDQATRTLQQHDLTSTDPVDKAQKKVDIETHNSRAVTSNIDAGKGIFVGAIRVAGATDVPAEAFAAVIEPYVGKTLSNADLAMLCHQVADVARQRGYSFATAYVPAQAVSLAVLSVNLDEGVISRILVNGTKNRHVLATLNKLTGHAPTERETERQILIAAGIPGIIIKKVKYTRIGDQGILIFDILEKRINGYVGVDNLGSDSLGPVRATGVAEIAHVLMEGDKVTVQALITPIKPNELAFVALKYDLPIDNDGTVLSGTATVGRVRPGGILENYQVEGTSYDLALAIKRPIVRNQKTSLWLGAELEYLSSRQNILGFNAIDDHVSTMVLSVNGSTKVLGGELNASATLTHGLPVLGASRLGDPLSSRATADALLTKLVLSADWTGNLIAGLSMRAATMTQITSDPLFSGQQISYGGPTFGRAYDFSELSGDYGTLASLELRRDFMNPFPMLSRIQPYIFVDTGAIKNIGGLSGGGTLYSGGGGIRAFAGKYNFTLEGAAPLKSNPNGTSDLKPRVNVQFLRLF